jgi:hypothetical protein
MVVNSKRYSFDAAPVPAPLQLQQQQMHFIGLLIDYKIVHKK